MKILLTGKTGQIGGELNNIVGDLGKLITVDKEQLDLSKPNSIEPVILDIKPDIIINPASYTAVDKAEEEPDLAMTVNAIAPGLLAQAAKKQNYKKYMGQYIDTRDNSDKKKRGTINAGCTEHAAKNALSTKSKKKKTL